MTFTISDLEVRIESKIHSANINQVNDIYGLIYEASGNILSVIDPRETQRKTSITNALYDQVYDYIAPTDLKADCIIDIRPQTLRNTSDELNQTSSRPFDRTKKGFTVEDNSGVRTVRISPIGLRIGSTINECESATANGTWAATAVAGSLATDTYNKITGGASLVFNLTTGGTSGYIENSTMTAVDLSSIKNNGALFMWVYIPSITAITAVALRWGSSSANYYSVSATTTQDNTAFVVGWNLLRFDWNGLTPTGTPVDTAINYLRVTFTTNGTAVSSCRVDSIVARAGVIYEMLYYSKYLFKTTAGVWIEKPTVGTDIVNLDVDGLNLLVYEVAELVAFELQKKDSAFDVQYWTKKKAEVWTNYKLRNKSRALKRQNSYYPMI